MLDELFRYNQNINTDMPASKQYLFPLIKQIMDEKGVFSERTSSPNILSILCINTMINIEGMKYFFKSPKP